MQEFKVGDKVKARKRLYSESYAFNNMLDLDIREGEICTVKRADNSGSFQAIEVEEYPGWLTVSRMWNAVLGMSEKHECSSKCECGAHVINSTAHSTWCPQYA